MSKITDYIQTLHDSQRVGPMLVHHEVVPAHAAVHSDPVRPLPQVMQGMMGAYGVKQLFSHQAMAIDAARSGRDVVVATPTASGKTLCYNLPVFEQIFSLPDSRAMYLFPLKALAQDQLGTIRKLAALAPSQHRIGAAVYDGDTSPYQRKKLRDEPPDILLTNPEMLHLSLLPYHGRMVWISGQPDPRGGGRGPYLPGRDGIAHGFGFPAAQADLQVLRGRPGVHPLFCHAGESRGTGRKPDRAQAGSRAGKRRAAGDKTFRFRQSHGVTRIHGHPDVAGRPGTGAAHHRLCPVAAHGGAYRHVGLGKGRKIQEQDQRVPLGVSPGRAARDRGAHGLGRSAGRGLDQCLGTGHRHRRPGCLHPVRLSRFRDADLAARRPRGAQTAGFRSRPGGRGRRPGPIFHAPPAGLFPAASRVRRGQSVQSRHSGAPSGLRSGRAVPAAGRGIPGRGTAYAGKPNA